uniref:Putative subtilase-type serine protease n=1 Tax=Mycobacterium riyadhense TaxID=486698 RepID=A0A653EY77_9MYCO|nr:putative subtilase-type serine protease precursor [Mycobacterium riyadhense]
MSVVAALRLAAGLTAVSAMVAVSGGVAGAVEPPEVPVGTAPADPAPEPDQPMRQIAACTVTGVLPGSDLRELPPALQLMNMAAAWKESTGTGVVVGIIDTGVAAQPRLPHLVAGGDYVMGRYGDGLADCDGHGTVVASLIGAAPSGAPLPAEPHGAAPAPPPPGAPAPAPVPPPPPPPTVTVTQTVSPPPPPPPEDEPAWIAAPAAGPGSGGAAPLAPPPGGGPDGLIGVAPDAVLVSIRQTAQTFGLADPGFAENPEDIRRAGDINSLARAVVHAANLGVKVINISVVSCISVTKPQDQAALGAALRYAAVDRDVVIVTAAGNAGAQGCTQNPDPVPANSDDPLGWESVSTIATPAWFSDYVLSVSATDTHGVPLTGQAASLHGPWVGIAAPGTDIVGLSTNGEIINGTVDNDTLHQIAGSSFSSAFVAGVAALVRAKFPQLSAYQVIHRLQATAHPPAAGHDTVVGYGVVDPLAALTWDVPAGALLAPGVLRGPLQLPAAPAQPDPRPGRVAGVITAAAVSTVLAVALAVTVLRRRQG